MCNTLALALVLVASHVSAQNNTNAPLPTPEHVAVATATASPEQDRGLRVKPPPADAVTPTGRVMRKAAPTPTREDSGKRYALFVGCGTFQDEKINALPFAEKDAKDLYELLGVGKRGLFASTTLLTGAKATRDGILTALRTIAKKSKPEDFIFVFYAGHGVVDSINTLEPQKAYLVTHDTRLSNVRAQSVAMDEFVADLIKTPAREVIVVLDTCHSGAASAGMGYEKISPRWIISPTSSGTNSPIDYSYINTFVRGEGRHLLTACKPNEQAIEHRELENGLLTYFLMRGLQGDADVDGNYFVTLDEVRRFVFDNVRSFSQDHATGGQTPTLHSSLSGGDVLVLSTVLNDNATTSEVLRRRLVMTLNHRIQENRWDDGQTVAAIRKFLIIAPTDPASPSLRAAWHRHEYQLVEEKIGRIPLKPSDERSVRLWKLRALALLEAYGSSFPESTFLTSIRDRAKEVDAFAIDQDDTVRIPRGPFTMGREFGGGKSERPQVTPTLDAYRIDRFEVTNAEYSRFITIGGYENKTLWSPSGWEWKENNRITAPAYWNNPQLGKSRAGAPVVGVSWYEADAFAQWKGAELPTEAQWERAARGDEGTQEYPWLEPTIFNTASNSYRANFWSGDENLDGIWQTASRSSHPEDRSPSGCRHMAGNVSEWCRDAYDPDYYARAFDFKNPLCERPSHKRVTRGGAWSLEAHRLSVTQRNWAAPGFRFQHVGFRLVREDNL
jgi:iron(II)-dependent oxidoreductase